MISDRCGLLKNTLVRMHVSWLTEKQNPPRRWVYVACGIIAIGWFVLIRSGFAAYCLLAAIAACLIQCLRPTVLGWIVLLSGSLAGTYAVTPSSYDPVFFPYYLLNIPFLLAAVVPAALLVLFRPRITKTRQAAAVAIGIALAVAVVYSEDVYRHMRRPLGFPRGMTSARPAGSLTPEEVRTFLDQDFQLVYKVRNLPPAVRGYFTETAGTRFTMADRGRDFESTDVVIDPGRPSLRLDLAGVAPGKTFILYEHGGIGLSYNVIMFKLSQDDRITHEWLGYCGGPEASLASLRTAFQNGECGPKTEYPRHP